MVHKVPNLHTTIILKCYGSLGAQRRSRTFKHWFLRPAALPVCIFVHIRSGATIVLYVTNPARRGYRDKLKLLPRLADNWSLLSPVYRTGTIDFLFSIILLYLKFQFSSNLKVPFLNGKFSFFTKSKAVIANCSSPSLLSM